MSRPSDRKAFLLHGIAGAFAPIASAVGVSGDAAAKEARAHIVAALEAFAQYSRDTRETSRRDAYGAACMAYAVAASAATLPGSLATRRALVGYASALRLATGAQNDWQGALHAAEGAARALIAQARDLAAA